MIPLGAVIPLEDSKSVYVVQDGKAQRSEVELGFMTGWQVQVIKGLSPGDRLIVSGHRFVAPGQAVRERPSQPAANRATSQPAPEGPSSGRQ